MLCVGIKTANGWKSKMGCGREELLRLPTTQKALNMFILQEALKILLCTVFT